PVAFDAGQYTDITGKVTISGVDPSVLSTLTDGFVKGMGTVPYCVSGNAYTKVSPFEKQQQDYRVGPGNTLGNVLVWIEPTSKDLYFPIPADQLNQYKDKKKLISQPHCVFLPHCTVLFPKYYDGKGLVATGEKLAV